MRKMATSDEVEFVDYPTLAPHWPHTGPVLFAEEGPAGVLSSIPPLSPHCQMTLLIGLAGFPHE